MSKRILELFLFDTYIAILKIENVVKNFNNSQDLLHHYISWDSVIREFEIIGEATNKLLKANIIHEDNRVVVDFRNLLIHHYFGIDSDEVWNVIEDNIPDYKQTILAKIKAINNPLKTEIIDSLINEYSYLSFILENIKLLK